MQTARAHSDLGDAVWDPGLLDSDSLKLVLTSDRFAIVNSTGNINQHNASENSSDCLLDSCCAKTVHITDAPADPTIGSMSMSCGFLIRIFGHLYERPSSYSCYDMVSLFD
jgi:hypothetical protein